MLDRSCAAQQRAQGAVERRTAVGTGWGRASCLLRPRARAVTTRWLWWAGPGSPDLDTCWRAYIRRFDLAHTFRFCTQALGWTTPRVRTPEQADRWTWLIRAGYTQLRLARPITADARLPWERRLPTSRVTPTRVRRGFAGLLPVLDTPVSPPKPCGRSPGRPKGSRRGPAPVTVQVLARVS